MTFTLKKGLFLCISTYIFMNFAKIYVIFKEKLQKPGVAGAATEPPLEGVEEDTAGGAEEAGARGRPPPPCLSTGS